MFIPLPTEPLPVLPQDLADLLAASRAAGAKLDHVTSWRCVSQFAADHWLADASDLPSSAIGEFFALRHAVADQLELKEEAEQARLQWLHWAEAADIPAAILHARSYGAYAEAESFIDANPSRGADGRKPSDQEVPELVALTEEITAQRPTLDKAYHFALSAAVTGAVAAMGRRPDLAQRLATWTAKWAPKKSGSDDRRLLIAQVAFSQGDYAQASAICEEVAEHPTSEPITSTVEARQLLAFLKLELDSEAEAIAQLDAVVRVGFSWGFTIAVLRSARLLTALLNAHGRSAEAATIARRALAASSGMPVNPLTMDIQLILARSLFDTGEYAESMELAEPVSQWSMLTDDEERTDAAVSITASAAMNLDDLAAARNILVEHAEHLARISDAAGAAKAFQQAARTVASVGDRDPIDEAAALVDEENLMMQARSQLELVPDGEGWHEADWNDDLAFIYCAHGRDYLALDHAERAAAGYLRSGDGEEAARALLTGVKSCLQSGDSDAAHRFADRIEELLPSDVWDGHPLLDALYSLFDQYSSGRQ